MKFKLKSFSEWKSTMLPRIAAALLSFGIKWVLSVVIFGTFFCKKKKTKTSKISSTFRKSIRKKKHSPQTRGVKSGRSTPYATSNPDKSARHHQLIQTLRNSALGESDGCAHIHVNAQ